MEYTGGSWHHWLVLGASGLCGGGFGVVERGLVGSLERGLVACVGGLERGLVACVVGESWVITLTFYFPTIRESLLLFSFMCFPLCLDGSAEVAKAFVFTCLFWEESYTRHICIKDSSFVSSLPSVHQSCLTVVHQSCLTGVHQSNLTVVHQSFLTGVLQFG